MGLVPGTRDPIETWTVYNGNTADENPYADFSASGTLQTRYLDGLAVDELFARTSASGATAWYLRDNVGSFYADVTTTMVLDAVICDPYGNIVTETNASEGDRFKFAGMEYDSVTGLYYDHARYYDAAIGRFVSQDSRRFAAGDTNLYRYVRNDPVNTTDPTGHWSWEGAKGGAIVGAGLVVTAVSFSAFIASAPVSIPVLIGVGVIGGLLGGGIGSVGGTLGGDDPRKQYLYGGASVIGVGAGYVGWAVFGVI